MMKSASDGRRFRDVPVGIGKNMMMLWVGCFVSLRFQTICHNLSILLEMASSSESYIFFPDNFIFLVAFDGES